jgi:hypothetical protein
MPAIERPGRILVTALAGLLLALTASVTPAHAGTPATGRIVGSIRNGDQPVPGATVEAVDAGSPWGSVAVATSLTDATGGFQLSGVPAGSWLLRTTMPGGWLVQFYPATQDPTKTAVAITLTAGQTRTINDGVLPHGTITGQITTNSGAPAAGAYVGVSHPEYTIRTTTDADGRYLLDYLIPGSLSVYAMRGLSAPVDYVAGSGKTVPLAAGQLLNLDDRLLPVGAITGTYTGTQGPIYATVGSYAGGEASIRALTSADDGSYTIWLRPGDYTLHFDSVNDNRDQWATAAMTEADAEVFTVREDEVVHHDEQTLPTGTVAGRVVDYAGVPFADATTVTLHDSGGWTATQTTTDSTGHWSVDVAPGSYTVEFVHRGRYQYAHGKLDSSTADPVTVGPRTVTALPDEYFFPNTFLIVSATLGGKPVNTFCATVDTATDGRQCTEDGSAYFSDTYPGSHQVTVDVPGHSPAASTVTVVDLDYSYLTVPVS